jgi:alkanesulfonate monooxygenase SsuD/methylene tetrahydromethanopterin reductase-like flavin-dependent oxidoreductase (luciferase family)
LRRLPFPPRGARRAGRSLDGFRTIFIVPIAVDESAAQAQRWVQRWFAPGQSFLTYPSASNLHWLRQAGIDLPDDHDPERIPDDQAARIADAFGLFGPPEHCVERLLRAREERVEHVFLRPPHLDGGCEMPTRQVDAPRRARAAPQRPAGRDRQATLDEHPRMTCRNTSYFADTPASACIRIGRPIRS